MNYRTIPVYSLQVGMSLYFKDKKIKTEKITRLEWGHKRLRVVVNNAYVYDRAGFVEVVG